MSNDNDRWYYFPQNESEPTQLYVGDDSRSSSGSAGFEGFTIQSQTPENPRLIIQHEEGNVIFELDLKNGFGKISEGVKMNEVAQEFFSALSLMVTHFGAQGRHLSMTGTVIKMTLKSGPEDSSLNIHHTGEIE